VPAAEEEAKLQLKMGAEKMSKGLDLESSLEITEAAMINW
jgi:hypothetical protein